jgi:predicted kinase
MPQAVIFIGVQATGKSTFFKERFADTHVRINLDMLKTRHREKLILEACIEAHQNFVVDNTTPTIEDRRRYTVPAKAANFEVIGYYFQSQLNATLWRNQQRVDKQHIPMAGVMAAYRKLQVPTLEEGFDKLYYVHIATSGKFIVEEWHDEV